VASPATSISLDSGLFFMLSGGGKCKRGGKQHDRRDGRCDSKLVRGGEQVRPVRCQAGARAVARDTKRGSRDTLTRASMEKTDSRGVQRLHFRNQSRSQNDFI
jgi:hypothetical protein